MLIIEVYLQKLTIGDDQLLGHKGKNRLFVGQLGGGQGSHNLIIY